MDGLTQLSPLDPKFYQQAHAALNDPNATKPGLGDYLSGLGQLANYMILGRGGVGNPADAIKKIIGQRQALSGGHYRPPKSSEIPHGGIGAKTQSGAIRYENAPPGWAEEYPISWLTDSSTGKVIRDPNIPRALAVPDSDITRAVHKKLDFGDTEGTRWIPMDAYVERFADTTKTGFDFNPMIEGSQVNLDMLWNYLKGVAP